MQKEPAKRHTLKRNAKQSLKEQSRALKASKRSEQFTPNLNTDAYVKIKLNNEADKLSFYSIEKGLHQDKLEALKASAPLTFAQPRSIRSGANTPKSRKDSTFLRKRTLSYDYVGDTDLKVHRVASSHKGGHQITLIECSTHSRPPYRVILSLESYLIMTIHAHLSSHEVIGFLSGKIDGNRLEVNYTIPASSLKLEEGVDPTTEVEADPVSFAQASEQAAKRGERLLGWYHSHPTFLTHPSNIDVKNHFTLQDMYNREDFPFFGFILGPFFKENPQSMPPTCCQPTHLPSTILTTCFHVVYQKNKKIPYHLPFEVSPAPYLDSQFSQALDKLLKIQTQIPVMARTDFTQVWSRNLTLANRLQNYISTLLKQKNEVTDREQESEMSNEEEEEQCKKNEESQNQLERRLNPTKTFEKHRYFEKEAERFQLCKELVNPFTEG